ncbi:MAG: fatty acid desaturase [Pseudomonadota bacterium]
MQDYSSGLTGAGPVAGARDWSKTLAPYCRPDNLRGSFELAITLVPFVSLWVLMWLALEISYLATLLLSVPTAAFLVRLFMVQHDCGHGTMFTTSAVNSWVGRLLGVLTLTPYDYWRRTHAMHHAGSGNLDRRGIGDIDTLTVAEYSALTRWERLAYRIYRHPLVLFGIGPAYMFICRHRFPTDIMSMSREIKFSTLATNLAIVGLYALLIAMVGWQAFLLIQVPVIVLASSLGVWLFYIQHQFDPTYWATRENWSRTSAALHGSSYYDLPAPLMWMTGNIGIHQVHHLCSHIPYHRLPQVLKDYPELKQFGRLTLWRSFGCVRLTLWDEDGQRLVSFADARAQVAGSS